MGRPTIRVKNPQGVRQDIYDYYNSMPEEDLWLPSDPSHRHFRFVSIEESGICVMRKIKDRVDTKPKLKRHLRDNYVLNPYYTTSRWLNPSNLGAKDRNTLDIFLKSDFILDLDTMDVSEVKKAYSFLEKLYDERMTLRFSGGGFHICIHDWYDNPKDISKPREREEDCQNEMRLLCKKLVENGIDFDYRLGNNEEEFKITSPSHNSRGIFKLPSQCITHHGTIAEFVDINNIEDYKPTKLFDIELGEPMTFDRAMEKIDNAIEAQ